MPFKSEAQRRWMHANHPKMAKKWEEHTAKDKSLPEYVKKSEEQDSSSGLNTAKTLAVPVAAAGVTGLAAKAFSDVENVKNKFKDWDTQLNNLREKIEVPLAAGRQHYTPEESQKYLDAYIQGATNITNKASVAGTRAGDIALAKIRAGLVGPKILDYLKQHVENLSPLQAIKDRGKLFEAIKQTAYNPAVEHYKMYSSPDISLNTLRKHQIEEAFKKAGPDAYKFLENINIPDSPQWLGNLMKAYKENFGENAYKNIQDDLLRRGTIVDNSGLIQRLVGNREATLLGTARAYQQTVPGILKKMLNAKNPILLGGAALTALTGARAYQKLKDKEAQDESSDLAQQSTQARNIPFDLAASLGLGAGGGIALKGAKNLINPNRNIAVTYGKMTPEYGSWDIGAGHSAPGDALYDLLEKAQAADPELKKFNLSKIVRNQAGIVDPAQLKDEYNLIADTGLGLFADYDNPRMNMGKKQHPDFFDHSNARPYDSRVSLMTDMFHSKDPSMSGSTFQGLTPKDYALYYGPASEQEANLRGRGVTTKQINKTMTPLVSANAIEAARDLTPKDVVLNNLAELKPELASQIQDLAGKKIITVSGSGRGDYVAERAIELSRELERKGIKDTKIIALTASAGNDPKVREVLSSTPHVVPVIGRVDPKTFVGLQRIADVHMASTGTSSLTESMMQSGGMNVVPKEWGKSGWGITPGTIADRWKNEFKSERHLPDLDYWNKGNKEFAASMPGGLQLEDDASKIVDMLQNPEILARTKIDAHRRAAMVNKDIDEGRKNVTKIIFDIAKKNANRRFNRGALGLLGGLGLAGGSLAAWLKHEKNKQELPSQP